MNIPIDVTGVTLTTERLVLRPFEKRDLNDFYEYASVDGVGQMAGWKPHESIAESSEILDMFIREKKTFAVVYEGKVIGSLGIEQYNEDRFPEFSQLKAREIGYVLAKDHWGKGLMPEAVREAVRWLFEGVGLDVIFCEHFLSNAQSARVQAKCGFTFYSRGKFETRMGTVENVKTNLLKKEDWLKSLKNG